MGKQTEFYNRFCTLYPLWDSFFEGRKGRLIEEVNRLPLGKLLEIGVGHGGHLRKYKPHEITGIDISSGMLEFAQKQKPEHVNLLQMNAENLAFADQTFDYLVMSHVIAVVDDPTKILDEAHRVLKKDGKMIILNHFTPKNWLGFFDRAFSAIAKWFHFTSLFYDDRLKDVENFKLEDEIGFGRLSYYKLLIFSKA